MGWSRLNLVTDAELGNLEPEATHSSRPWGAATWPHERAEAKRTLKIWLERDYAPKVAAANRTSRFQIPLPSITDRILDTWSPDWVYRYTGGSYVDVTTSARDDTDDDVNLSTALATAATDRIYVGALYEFEGIDLKLFSTVNAVTSTLSAKYWSPTGWRTLSSGDGTSIGGKTLAQSGRILWTLPDHETPWIAKRLAGTGDEFYWVEISVSVALTADVVATQILPVRAPDGLKRVAAYLALAHIFRGLAAQAAQPADWLARATTPQRTGYADMAEDLYASLRDNGGIPIDLNADQAIDAHERAVTQPVRLYRG